MITVTVKFRQGTSHKPTRFVVFSNLGDVLEVSPSIANARKAHVDAFMVLYGTGRLPKGKYAIGRLREGFIFTHIAATLDTTDATIEE